MKLPRRFKNESAMQRWVKKTLEAEGALVLNIHGHAMQAPGWPDLQVNHKSWCGFIELKVLSGPLSTAQKIIIERLRARNVAVVVLRWSGETLDSVNMTGSVIDSFREESGDKLIDWLVELRKKDCKQ